MIASRGADLLELARVLLLVQAATLVATSIEAAIWGAAFGSGAAPVAASAAGAIALFVARARLERGHTAERVVHAIEGVLLATLLLDLVLGILITHALPPAMALVTRGLVPVAVIASPPRAGRTRKRSGSVIAQPAGGSPMYRLLPEHGAAVVALVAMLLAGWWLVRRAREPRAPMDLLLAGLLAASAAVHLGLALGDLGHDGATRAFFLADAALLAIVARRVWRGAPAGRLGVAVLVGSIVAYWGVSVGGHAPDQLAILTKLAEVVALAIVVRRRPDDRRAVRSALRAAAIVVLVVGTSASTWAGAFRAASATQESVSGHHVHDGGVAPPGTLLPAFPDREPTAAERLAATQLISSARAALARYADPAVAAADGYRVAGIHGIDFHAPNPAYEKDGRVLDPAHPETLVYALAPDGHAVLMGALFQMSELGEAGPAIGGPLTMWHAHEHVCISLTPPALAGVQSPLGMCPLGSVDVPMTAQMIHLWIVPGAPQPFGDLDDAWKRAYLESLARGD